MPSQSSGMARHSRPVGSHSTDAPHHHRKRSHSERTTSIRSDSRHRRQGGGTDSQRRSTRESSRPHHRKPSSSADHQRKHRHHHRTKSHYSTSRSPLRGRRRNSSRHSRHQSPSIGSGRNHSGKDAFSFASLRNILVELLGHSEHASEVMTLTDAFGDLLIQGIADRLVLELKNGLLERLLIDWLKDVVKGSVRKSFSRAGKGAAARDGEEEQDWKKSLLKKAFLSMARGAVQANRHE